MKERKEKEVKVIMLRTVESAKFGIFLHNLSEHRGWTYDNKRFYVEVSDVIRMVVDKKDLAVI
jgi:hypothetical protein